MTYRDWLQERLDRQRAFFASGKKGDVLFTRGIIKFFETHWEESLFVRPFNELFNSREIERVNRGYIDLIENDLNNILRYDDETLPTPEVCFGIGSIVAAMGGGDVRFIGGISWCPPPVKSWGDMDNLRFDPDNVWIRFCVEVYKNLNRLFDGQFLALPYVYRSPLDGVNGLRGDALFYDMYDSPDNLKELIKWCAEWNLAMERHIRSETGDPHMGRGAWNVALPDGGVFLNGDPVDLISEDFLLEFDKPYNEEFLTRTGGGFLHHHALGFRQTGQVASYKGLIAQNILTDPNQPVPAERMVNYEQEAETIVKASLFAPVHLNGDFSPYFDRLLPILKQGRFILRYEGPDELSGELINKLNRVRNPF